MTNLSLAQRLLARIAQISERSDVIVQQQTTPWGSSKQGRLKKWKDKLPADMYAFYEAINGMVFHYTFADAPGHWHGLEFVALDEGGRKTIDTKRRIYRLPHQPAKRYPKYFFGEGEVSPEAPVLFFFGSDDAWGVIMLGEGEGATFHHWDNDGFVKSLGGSFTQLIERLIDRGFAHTWAYSDSHPDTDDVLRRLAIPLPPRKTFEVTVQALEERSASDHRRRIIAAYSEDQRLKAARALGLAQRAKGASSEQVIALIDEACSSLAPITEKVATATMKAFGYRRRFTVEEFGEFFRCGAGPVTAATIRVKHFPCSIPLSNDVSLLPRIFHCIEGLHVTDGSPFPSEMFRFLCPWTHKLDWTPFVSSATLSDFDKSGGVEATFAIIMDSPRARGLEAGKTYISSALPSVESRIG